MTEYELFLREFERTGKEVCVVYESEKHKFIKTIKKELQNHMYYNDCFYYIVSKKDGKIIYCSSDLINSLKFYNNLEKE